LAQALEHTALTQVQSYRAVVFLYAALGVGLAFLFTRLSTLVEVNAVSNDLAHSSGVANVLGISALLASRLAAQIGLIRTMVVTHLPSNILLILVPLMPNLSLAVVVLLLRFSISQMDVPTRQSYTMSVVPAEERSAAGGFTGVARTTGAAISPLLAGFMFGRPSLISAPFFIAGTLKIVYDLLLFHSFRQLRPPEEA